MKRLLILSGKGGTGKTTVAGAFIRFSRARAMADCDVDAPNLHLLLGRETQPERLDFMGGDKAAIDGGKCVGCGLCAEKCRFGAIEKSGDVYRVNEYSCEGCGVCARVCPRGAPILLPDKAGEQYVYKDDSVFSTARLKMGRGNSGKLVSAVKQALLKNAPDCELAIIDGSPGIGCPVMASVSGVDMALVVAEPSLSGLSDLKRLVSTARLLQAKLAVCVNKYQVCPQKAEEIESFCREENIPFLGFLPYDETASEAINRGGSVADTDGPLARALERCYEELVKLLGL